jgi:NADH:ubiquinone oxidoreductase subunit 6 (subunit J)
MGLYILLAVGILVCAVQAIRVNRLLYCALWLAGTSALMAILIYLLGAPEIAVIELSVGAGLVTVLFIFAINIAGEEIIAREKFLPRPVAWLLIATAMLLLGWLVLPNLVEIPLADTLPGISSAVWEARSLDVLLQIVMIFSGVLGLLGLLAESKPHKVKEGEG